MDTTYFIIIDIVCCDWNNITLMINLDPPIISLLSYTNHNATWAFDPVVMPLPKKSHPSMRAWVQFLDPKIYVCVSLD